jgi:hypothetical protein
MGQRQQHEMPRRERLNRCKANALALLDAGRLELAVEAMTPEETQQDADYPDLMRLGRELAQRGDAAGIRQWIAGFF